MSTVLRFEDENTKAINRERVKQQRVIPVGTLLYVDSINLPTALSKNTLLFTTDTRELYIGTGTGIARVNIGSDGEVIDKGDYLSKTEAAQIYVQKDYLDPDSVVTDQEMKDFIAPLAKTVEDLITDSNFKADKDGVYSKGESNERFIDNDEFSVGMSKKVDQEILTNTGNHAFIKNLSTGLMMKFQNLGGDVESYVNVGKDKIILYSKRTKDEEFGGRIYITPAGVFYSYSNDEAYGKDNELVTMADLNTVQDMYNQIVNLSNETRQIAMRSVESARNSELAVEQAKAYIDNAVTQSTDAYNLAQEAFTTVERVNSQLLDAYTNSTSSLQKSINAESTAAAAKAESGEALTRLRQFETSISSQFEQLVAQMNIISSGGTISDDGRKKIIAVQNFDDVYEVPYHTEAADLNLPAEVAVTLEDNTFAIVPVVWQRSRFQSHQTEYSQQITGVLTETGTVKNPNFLFAIYTVRVMPETQAEQQHSVSGWEVTFAMSHMNETVEDFGAAIGHPELISEDIMGTFDTMNNYVSPDVQLFLLGTLKAVDKTFTGIKVLNPIERANLVNNNLATFAPDGLRVPIHNVALAAEIADYETQAMTLAHLNSNGPVSYSEGVLMFDHAVDSNVVYVIRKSAVTEEG